MASNAAPTRAFTPPTARPALIANWLLAVAGLVFLMVVVGGITRLTESGLSITEWKPVTGAIPPLNEAQWIAEFQKYQQIPEYKELTQGMSLSEFKFIFCWEWVHRLLGRLIGKRFIADTPFERLQHFPRYLKAVAMRLDKLRANPARDAQLMAEYAPLWTNYERRAIVLAKQGVTNAQVEQFRWMLEELRVQLFAQELRTPAPVSVKRLQKMWEGI